MSSVNGSIFINPLLTGAAIGAVAPLNLVCAQAGIFTPTRGNKTGTFLVRSLGDYMGDADDAYVALEADYKGTDTTDLSTGTFELKAWKKYEFVSAALQAFSQVPGDHVKEAGVVLGRRAGFFAERKLRSTLFNASNFTAANVSDLGGGGVKWSNYVAARPDVDIRKAMIAFKNASNTTAVDMVIAEDVLDAYAMCLASQNLIVTTSGAGNAQLLNQEQAIQRLRTMHGLNVMVGRSRYNTAAPGLTVSGSYIWTDGFWIGILAGPPGIQGESGIVLSPRAVAGFSHMMEGTGLTLDGVSLPVAVSQTMQEPPKNRGTVVAAEMYIDVKLLSGTFGYYVKECVA